jgi:inorganic pyrophosphatase
LPEATLRQIEHFFEHYKDLEDGKWVRIQRWGNAEEAMEIIATAHRRYKNISQKRRPTLVT